MKMLYVALLCMTISNTAEALVVTQHDYTPERSGAINAQSVSVTPGKLVGFVTCGGTNFGYVHSTGCEDVKADKVIPWTTYPGYRLGGDIPASYRVTGISFDSYNRIATVYFEY